MSIFAKPHSYCFGRVPRIVVSINTFTLRRNSTDNITVTSSNAADTYDDHIAQERDLEIEKLRDKSRIKPCHRNVLFNRKPYSEPMTEAHLTVKYNRKMYGKYGSESGVNPGIMWPTKKDIEERKEYEKIAYPFTIQELIKLAKDEEEMKAITTQKQHDQVVANFLKLESWKKELKEKLAKKEAEALAAKEKKERLIEEVRRHFGFKVDPKDDRFKEMLAVKEKEQRKKDRQARMESREQKAVEKLLSKTSVENK